MDIAATVISSILGAFLFLGVVILIITAIFSCALRIAGRFRRFSDAHRPSYRQRIEPVRPIERKPTQVAHNSRIDLDAFQFEPRVEQFAQTPVDHSQVIQYQRNGRMIWQPTPTVDTSESAVLDEAWISALIDAPGTIKQGKTLVLRVEISNNHRRQTLKDEGMLEVEYPSSAVQVLGSESIKLDPEGDTTLIYFPWTAPYLPGNYILRFTLLNHQARTERALVVQ